MKILIMLAALAAQDADEAVKTFHEALKGASEEERIEAAREALGTVHEKVIKTVGKLIHTDTEKVRVDVARAIGKVDHPSSVDVLVKALSRHRKTPGVLGAIARGLGDLGWERAAPSLNKLLSDVGNEDIRSGLTDVVVALAQIGSESSVEPLINFLNTLKGKLPKLNPKKRLGSSWQEAELLTKYAMAALASITGGSGKNVPEWRTYWSRNRKELLASATSTWWNRKTMDRTVTSRGEKKPSNSLLVGKRLTAPPPASMTEGR